MSADRRGETDALIVLVAKQGIADGDGVAFLDQQTRCESHKVSGFHSVGRDASRIGEAQFSSSANRKVEAFFYGDGVWHNFRAKIGKSCVDFSKIMYFY